MPCSVFSDATFRHQIEYVGVHAHHGVHFVADEILARPAEQADQVRQAQEGIPEAADGEGVQGRECFKPLGEHRLAAHARGTTEYQYDALGRPTLRGDPDGGVAVWTWDPPNGSGLPAGQAYGTAFSESYAYDARARLESATTRIEVDGSSEEFTIRHGYDDLGRLVSTTYPSKLTVVRSYNPRGRLSAREAEGRVLVDYRWKDAFGNLTREHYGNGLVTQRDFDPRTSRLVSPVTTRGPGWSAPRLQSNTYAWRSDGSLEARTWKLSCSRAGRGTGPGPARESRCASRRAGMEIPEARPDRSSWPGPAVRSPDGASTTTRSARRWGCFARRRTGAAARAGAVGDDLGGQRCRRSCADAQDAERRRYSVLRAGRDGGSGAPSETAGGSARTAVGRARARRKPVRCGSSRRAANWLVYADLQFIVHNRKMRSTLFDHILLV